MNARLLKCAEFVQGDAVCDVGTDHALLPIYLMKTGKVRKAIASDIGEKPLAIAGQHISDAGLDIQTVLSDGLQNVSGESLTDIVIAGMGGETIIHILDTCPFSLNDKNLILQPMTKHDVLRKWLFENGFEISKEACVPDKKFLYTVMQVRFTGNAHVPSPAEIHFGNMYLSDKNNFDYVVREFDRLCQIRRSSQHSELNEIINALDAALKEARNDNRK